MALEITYSSMDDVPENFRELYTEQNDGKVMLTGVNGMKTSQDVSNLQEALRKEREDHKDTKTKFAVFGDKDPQEVISQLDKLEEYKLAAEGKVDDEKIEKIVASRIATIKGPLEREISTLKATNEELLGTNEKLVGKERTRTIEDAVRTAVTQNKSGKVLDTAMEDVLIRARMTFDVGEDGKVIAKDGVGVTPGIDPSAWLQEMTPKAPHWFPQSAGGGANGSAAKFNGGKNPFSHEHWNLTDQGKMLREDRGLAEQAAKSAGTSIGGGRPPAPK